MRTDKMIPIRRIPSLYAVRLVWLPNIGLSPLETVNGRTSSELDTFDSRFSLRDVKTTILLHASQMLMT